MRPTEAIYLFVKENRKMMTPNRTIGEYARDAQKEELNDNPDKERVLRVVVRKTENF